MKHRRLPLLSTALLIVSMPSAKAQSANLQSSTPTQRPAPLYALGPNDTMVWEKQHAPLSAVLVEHVDQSLSDGTRISHESHETVMRDGLGRIYRAREVNRPGYSESEPRLIITITDPVQHVHYQCISTVRSCLKNNYQNAEISRGKFFTDKAQGVTVEDLGSSTISGVEVQGERVTRVIPEGSIGNDRPITDITETWHSKALEVDMQVTRTDPRIGTRTISLTQINLVEPDPQYFQVPEGYTVRDPGPVGALVPVPPVVER